MSKLPKDFSNATSWTRYDFIIQCASVRQHMLYELTLTLSRVQKCPEKMGGNLDGQIADRDVGSGVRRGGEHCALNRVLCGHFLGIKMLQ